MKRMRYFALTGSFLSLLTVLSLGCGSNSSTPGKLTGSVKLNGEPVTGGDLYIHTKGGTIRATISSTGSYTASDLPVGDWKVTVNTEALNPNLKEAKAGRNADKYKKGMSPPPQSAKDLKQENPGVYVPIPKQYQDVNTTPLNVEVIAGSKTHNFELTK